MSVKIFQSKNLYGISIFILILGGIALNPFLGLLFFIISDIFALGAIIKSKGWVKAVALIILILSIILSYKALQKSKEHMDIYKRVIKESQK